VFLKKGKKRRVGDKFWYEKLEEWIKRFSLIFAHSFAMWVFWIVLPHFSLNVLIIPKTIEENDNCFPRWPIPYGAIAIWLKPEVNDHPCVIISHAVRRILFLP
jgi:hypothetical protein